jgi:hypothetical protein
VAWKPTALDEHAELAHGMIAKQNPGVMPGLLAVPG